MLKHSLKFTRPSLFASCLLVFLWLSAPALGKERFYDLHYAIALHPADQSAQVTISLEDNHPLRELDFNIDTRRHMDIQASGDLTVSGGRAVWIPPATDAQLTLSVKITNERSGGAFDALMTEDWAIFRGDELIPAARVRALKGANSRARLTFNLPKEWPSVNTGWPSEDTFSFRIDNPERRFDRPVGWMIAGKLGTRRARLGDTRVAISAPRGSGLRRMDLLVFMGFVWPQVQEAFGSGENSHLPDRLLIVGAGDPMWRGGLSAPNSLFLHADRPVVSENGTSPLMHELFHMVARIAGKAGHDWIVEGLAEFYSIELLYRAGGITEARRAKIFESMSQWSADVESLVKPRSTGTTTARAALIFASLDRELRATSENRYNLDNLVRQLMVRRKVSLTDLRAVAEELLGHPPASLQTPLLENDAD